MNTVIKVKVKTNDAPDLFRRPEGERYNKQYMSIYKRSGNVSVHFWGWFFHKEAEFLHHIEGHPDALQYHHILQNVTVPSVRMLYPDGTIQDHSSIHDSRVVQ